MLCAPQVPSTSARLEIENDLYQVLDTTILSIRATSYNDAFTIYHSANTTAYEGQGGLVTVTVSYETRNRSFEYVDVYGQYGSATINITSCKLVRFKDDCIGAFALGSSLLRELGVLSAYKV